MPITYYSVDNIREALLNLRKDLHEIHYQDNNGKRRLASQVEAQETILLSVADMFNVNLDEQTEDEFAYLKQMKIAEINGCPIYLLSSDHTMVIIEKDAVFFRCTLCGEIKSVHMMAGSTEKDIPWLRLCFCGTNAPHAGGDTQPLPEEPEPAMPLDRTLMPTVFHTRLIEREHS